jgi:L-lysine 6-transaminase
MAGRRVDLVPDNVFTVSGRINSTWGGGLVDMVRSRRMLEIVERDGLIPRAAILGEKLLGALQGLEADGLVENARGRGLMCAFDVPGHTGLDHNGLVAKLRDDQGILVLPCGERSVRLRPALSVQPDELEYGLAGLHAALSGV